MMSYFFASGNLLLKQDSIKKYINFLELIYDDYCCKKVRLYPLYPINYNQWDYHKTPHKAWPLDSLAATVFFLMFIYLE